MSCHNHSSIRRRREGTLRGVEDVVACWKDDDTPRSTIVVWTVYRFTDHNIVAQRTLTALDHSHVLEDFSGQQKTPKTFIRTPKEKQITIRNFELFTDHSTQPENNGGPVASTSHNEGDPSPLFEGMLVVKLC